MTVPGNINAMLLGGQSSYKIERSLRFNSADSAYLSRTPASAGSQTTWTWSGWIKRSSFGVYRLFGTGDNNSATYQTSINLSSDSLDFYNVNGGYKTTTAKFRDPSAWYHVVVVWDSNNATASDRMRLYVNGVRLTAFSSSTDPSSGTNTVVNSAVSHTIGTLPTNSGNYFDGYLTEIHFIDGQALTPSSFGEINPVTGVWQPKRYTGTYGTNGFYLKFADNSGTTSTTLGKDSSGNGNNWTPNNFSVTAGAGNDSMIDTPTPYADGGNGRGNYCTLNPLTKSASPTPRDGNLVIAFGGTYPANVLGSIGVSSGKWYWEVLFNGGNSTNGHACGVAVAGWANLNLDPAIYSTPYSHYVDSRQQFVNNSVTTNNSTSFTDGDIIGVALNVDSNHISFYKNGTLIGSAQSLEANQTWFPFHKNSSYTSLTQTANFGQRPFAYTPPSGFLALNTQNLPEPTIKKPSSYMDVLTWTGNGAANNRSLTGLAFSPDLVWGKSRSNAYNNRLYDSVRGAGNNKDLTSNDTGAEGSGSDDLYGYISSFDSAGFSTTKGTVDNEQWNGLNVTYAAWCWDKSATPGFDIVTYTGTGSNQNISHSLGVAPSLLIVKNRTSGAPSWRVWHSTFTVNDYIYLDSTSAKFTSGGVWTALPTSTQFSINGTDAGVGANGNNYVAYLWSEVAGFSKFGSYTGNGSADGPFVYCGFRPRWVMLKRTDSAGNFWTIRDTARNTYNVADLQLYPNSSLAESSPSTGDLVDIISNGFKIRGTSSDVNASGGTYIFCAFAETPAKYSLAR